MTDWAATGSMLSGIGTVAGALAVGLAALLGRNTFKEWKAQRREERRMALAEEILALAYEFERVLSNVRSPMTLSGESDAAETSLREQFADYETKSAFQKRVMHQAQIIISRFASHKSFWERFFAVFPVSRAIFGKEVADALQHLWKSANSVKSAAQVYGGLDVGGDIMTKLEKRFWEGAESPDAISDAVGEQVSLLDRMLLKVLTG